MICNCLYLILGSILCVLCVFYVLMFGLPVVLMPLVVTCCLILVIRFEFCVLCLVVMFFACCFLDCLGWWLLAYLLFLEVWWFEFLMVSGL